MSLNQAEYKDKVAVITGGASGIGKSLTRSLIKKGANVCVLDFDEEKLAQIASEFSNTSKIKFYMIDVSNRKKLTEIFSAISQEHPNIDFLFNNAGSDCFKEIENHTPEDLQRMISTNVFGVINGIQAVLPIMKQQGSGHIINTGSIGSLVPIAFMSGYCATKHSIAAFTQILRLELLNSGVNVTLLCPGAVETPMLKSGNFDTINGNQLTLETMDKMWRGVRPICPDEFAEIALKKLPRRPAVLIIPWWWRIFWWIHRLSPSLSFFISRIIAKSAIKRVKKENS